MARHGTPGGETVLEGEAGFYHAYAGNNRGDLRYSFTGDNHTDLVKITQGLGRDWMFLETLYRIYSTAGYNIAHIEITARLCEEHNIRYDNIDRIEALVNWFETEYFQSLFNCLPHIMHLFPSDPRFPILFAKNLRVHESFITRFFKK
jgi:hypothetical protein